MTSFLACAAFLVFVTLCGVSGWLVADLLGLDFASPAVKALFAMGLGLNTVSYCTLALGHAHLLYAGVLWGLGAVLILCSIPRLWKCIRRENHLRGLRPVVCRHSWLVYLLLIILALSVAANFVAALAPPTGWDSLAYHLVEAKYYAESHRILALTDLLRSSFPQNIEMLFVWGQVINAETLAQLIAFMLGLCLCASVFLLARRHFSLTAALLAALLFYSIDEVTEQSSIALVDLGVALYQFLAVFSWLLWRQSGKRRWLVTAGIFAGGACGSKYTGCLAGAIIAGLLLAEMLLKRRKAAFLMSSLCCLLGPMALLSAPWLIWNWVVWKNPVWPLLSGIFGSGYLTVEDVQHWTSTILGYVRVKRTFWNLLGTAWRLTMHPELHDSGQIGPVFLATLPALPFARLPRQVSWPVGAYCLVYSVAWFWSSPMTRLFLAVVALLSVICAALLIDLSRSNKGLRYLVGIVVALWLTTSLGTRISNHADSFRVVVGVESREQYLSRSLGSEDGFDLFHLIEYLNQTLPEESLLMFPDPRIYYLEHRVVRPEVLVEQMTPADLSDSHALATALGHQGVNYVCLVDELAKHPILDLGNIDRLARFYDLLYDTARTPLSVEIYSQPGVHVYKLVDGGNNF